MDRCFLRAWVSVACPERSVAMAQALCRIEATLRDEHARYVSQIRLLRYSASSV